jgi:hypothetical protein
MTEEKLHNPISGNLPPGVCVPWEQKAEEMGELKGDPALIQKEWEYLDSLTYMYLWWWVHR